MQFLSENIEIAGILIALITLFWGMFTFTVNKRSETRRERFQEYHRLIKELVQQEDISRPLMLDRQVAVVFELQNYPNYRNPTLRILTGLKEHWNRNKSGDFNMDRLFDQIDETIEFLK